MNILIVDDEQSIRETCATVSEQCGMKPSAWPLPKRPWKFSNIRRLTLFFF